MPFTLSAGPGWLGDVRREREGRERTTVLYAPLPADCHLTERGKEPMSADSWDRALTKLTGGDRAYIAIHGRWAIVVLADVDGKPIRVVASFATFAKAEGFARENYPFHLIVESATVIPGTVTE